MTADNRYLAASLACILLATFANELSNPDTRAALLIVAVVGLLAVCLLLSRKSENTL
jgi:hypothetical protein